MTSQTQVTTGTKRYYNGVGSYWTTRCCSAFALIAACVSAANAQQTTVVDQPRVNRPRSDHRPDPNDNRNAAYGLFPVTELWHLSLNNLLLAPPAFKDDRGYFPIGDGQLAAYDVRHGTLLWIAPVHAEFQPILGERLIFVIEPNAIVALRDDTGVEAWRVALTESLAAPVTCHNGWLVAITASGGVLAFRASDGVLIWRQDLDALPHATVALVDDRVYVPMQDSRIIALQVETGEPVWEHRLGGPPNEILATSDFVYAGSTDNFFYALRARDGTIAWRWPTGADVVGRPIVDKHHVYFVSLDNVLRALDKNSGNLRWKRALTFRPTRGLVAMGDAVIASGISQSASVFWMKDGAPLGNMAGAGDELAAQPHPVVSSGGFPIVVLVSRDLDQGTIVSTWTRGIEPKVQPMAPLPNPVAPPAAPDALPVTQGQPADTDRATEDAGMP